MNRKLDFESFYSPNPQGLGVHRPQIGALAAFGIAMATTLVSAYLNKKITDDTNQQNRDWHNEDQDRLEAREDTALSRRVTDAKNAGLSPLAALQTGAAQSSMVQQAPAQAWQADLSAISDLAQADETTSKEVESNEKIEQMRGENAYKIATLEAQTQRRNCISNIVANKKMNDDTIASNEKIAGDKLAEEKRQFDANYIQKDNQMNLDYIKSVNNNKMLQAELQANADNFNAQQFSKIVDSNIDAQRSWCNDMGVTFKVQEVDINTPEDWKKYQSMLSSYENRKQSIMTTYQDYRNSNKDNPEALASLYSKSKNIAGGANAKLPENMQPLGNIGSVGLGLNGQYSDSQTVSKSEYNERMTMKALIGNQSLTYPVPRVRRGAPAPELEKWNKK